MSREQHGVAPVDLPKARLLRVAADVGMQAESEFPVSALDLSKRRATRE
jgi:hypothetical protein